MKIYKNHDKYQEENLQNIEDLLSETIGGRYENQPEDYPPSEWRQYQEHTAELKVIRNRITHIKKCV